jgi:hypothetical protein
VYWQILANLALRSRAAAPRTSSAADGVIPALRNPYACSHRKLIVIPQRCRNDAHAALDGARCRLSLFARSSTPRPPRPSSAG